MKASIKRFANTKGIVVASLIIMSMIASCKHDKGGCDAYQGSTRSYKKYKSHQAQVETVRQSVRIA
ncbi:MAG TPA: hypothetical protein VL651_05790 [Bacteroidia bacterium]|jgi:hypothetical protein|nr:hypothetical protein [Bacteroidia bacterium]